MEIRMFEAGNGDCFLISCNGETKTNILVDFGYSNTYEKNLEPYLKQLNIQKENIDLAIVTHIDQDHISGGIKFFQKNGLSNDPKIIGVNEVWHNSYRHLQLIESEQELTENEKNRIRRQSKYIEKNRTSEPQEVSARQGSTLAANILKDKYNWNGIYGGEAIQFINGKEVALSRDVSIKVLLPTQVELNKLKKVWRNELSKIFPGIKLNSDVLFDDATECISLLRKETQPKNNKRNVSATNNIKSLSLKNFAEDVDEINDSSITCIIKFKGKRILLLADSIPTKVINQVKEEYKNLRLPIMFDAIKISHHGSNKNTTNELLELIDSEHYFISTNGKMYGHPDVEVIAKIINRDTQNFCRNIYFTNKLAKLKRFDDPQIQEELKFKIHYRDEKQAYFKVVL